MFVAPVGKGTLVLAVVSEDGTTPSGSSLLDETVREGARRMPTVDGSRSQRLHSRVGRPTSRAWPRSRDPRLHQPRKVTTAAAGGEGHQNASSWSWSSLIFLMALGNFAP